MQNGLSTCESSSATPPPSLDSEELRSPKRGDREPQVEQGASEAEGSCEDMAVDKGGGNDVRCDVGEEEEEGLEEMDSDGYEYVYEDSEEEGEGQEVGGKPEGSRSRNAGRKAQHVVFSGLDRIGCTKDMLLKKELTRLKADVEFGKRGWNVNLTWAEATRMLGVRLEHEGFVKAELELTFPATYPQEPPLFHYKGPRFDDAVDFVLGADTLEPCRKENWNDTFSCSSLLTLVMELVKVLPPPPPLSPPSRPPSPFRPSPHNQPPSFSRTSTQSQRAWSSTSGRALWCSSAAPVFLVSRSG